MAISCPRCSEQQTRVRETRGNRRTRRCVSCGESFTTLELPEAEVEELEELRERYRLVVDAVEVLMTAPAPD